MAVDCCREWSLLSIMAVNSVIEKVKRKHSAFI